ncbi:MAG TPA: ATP-binding cassette domain-containing protein, partial [Acidimicrobiales bacterium]|nr:ATP-binding cassette domain-containing protein [Acidimicrobiales bacterium]
SVNVALTIADRAYFMEKGEVRFSGPTAELLERDDILRSVFLQGAGSVEEEAAGPSDESSETSEVDGRNDTVPAVPKAPVARTFGPPILEVSGITKRFGGIRAVNDVSFTLREGEIIGLIGPNGAGKTTIFDMLSGLISIDSGRIRFKGIDITNLGADKRSALGLGRSFQDARIFPPLTVAENIAIGLERHIPDRDHFASLLALPAVQETEADVRFTVEQLIELMNLGAFRDKFVSELSTGSRRIVDLAMAIAHDPSVLILDEPSSGIAQRETEALGPLLRRIQAETNCAMLVIEHDMPLIREVSDQLIALELGAVVTTGDADDVLTHPQVVSAYLGGDLDVINRSGGSVAMGAEAGTTGAARPADATAEQPALPPPGESDATADLAAASRRRARRPKVEVTGGDTAVHKADAPRPGARAVRAAEPARRGLATRRVASDAAAAGDDAAPKTRSSARRSSNPASTGGAGRPARRPSAATRRQEPPADAGSEEQA